MHTQPHNRAEWITALCTVLMACTAVTALLYAHWQLKQDREEAQVGRLLGELHKYDEEPMVGYRRQYAEERLKGVSEPAARYQLLDFFETIGLLVDRGYLDETDVWENFGYSVFPLYADSRDTIGEEQKDDPAYYIHFISLAERMQAVEKAQHGNVRAMTKEDFQEFWQDETKLVTGSPPSIRRPRHNK